MTRSGPAPDPAAPLVPLRLVPPWTGDVPTNLSVPLSSFVGRERELAEVGRLLAGGRLVTLTGVGGVGKTRLAREVARQAQGAYPDGVWFVDFGPLADPALVDQSLATTLGIMEPGLRPLREVLRDFLWTKRLLLLLDNCEHLLEASAVLASELLACPDLRVLATSREALGVDGEITWPVPPLALPEAAHDAEGSPLERVTRSEAVRLFVERAAAARPGFVLTPENGRAVAEICRQLDGLPLAIELAAVRVKAFGVADLASRLDDRFRLLTGGPRTAVPRHRTLGSAIAWSYDLLEPAERALFTRLSVFAGGWTPEAAEAVCAGEGIAPDTVLDLLIRLIDKSLVLAEAGPDGGTRYRLLETLRQYGAEQLAAHGALEAAQLRHASYFLALAAQAAPHLEGSESGQWLDRLEEEQDNLRAALRWFLAACPAGEGAPLALRLAAALQPFWYKRGFLHEGRSWLAQALAVGVAAPTDLQARARRAAGHLAWALGDYDAAWQSYQQALELERAHGDPENLVGLLSNVGMAAAERGDLEAARRHWEESVAAARRVSERWPLTIQHIQLGLLALEQGALDEADRRLAETATSAARLGDEYMLAVGRWCRAQVALARGKHERAAYWLRESLGWFRAQDGRVGLAMNLWACGALALAGGQSVLAARLVGASEALTAQLGFVPPPLYRARRQHVVVALRSALSEGGFEAARAEGAAWPLDVALAAATEVLTRPERGAVAPALTKRTSPLTRREREVAGLIAQGLTNREIASRLVIATGTAERHVVNILNKLTFTSRAQIAAWAVEHGLVDPTALAGRTSCRIAAERPAAR